MTHCLTSRHGLFLKHQIRCCLVWNQLNLHIGKRLRIKQGQNLGKDNGLPTTMELRTLYMKARGVKPGFVHQEDRSLEDILKYLPESQKELPPRRVKDTFLRAIIPLSSQPQLLEKYINFMGKIRLGRLMEDLDMFSDCVSMKYVQYPKHPKDDIPPFTMVTVLVDHIRFTDYVPEGGLDIRITGHVSHVGKTTVETTVWMDQIEGETYHRITTAIFLMAARDATLSKGVFVNPLVAEDDEEKRIVADGEARKRERERRASDTGSFLSKIPSLEEQQIVHKLFVESIDSTISRRSLPTNSAWMAESTRKNNIFTFAEDRNFHNTVFGGFLMRHALEMAWFTGYFYSLHPIKLKSISDIHFRHPVPLGAIISFHGQIVYTQDRLMQIFVHCDVNKPFESDVTSIIFNFTYESLEPIKCVKPNTYYEAMMYLDGRRHFLEAINRNNKEF